MHRFRGPLLVLLSRLAFIALIYTLLRITFVLLNQDNFPQTPLAAYWGGIRFDLSALAWLNLPWVLLCLVNPTEEGWYARVKKFVFHFANAVGFFFACADLEYYKFTLKRSTADIFGIMSGGDDVKNLASVFIADYWYIVLIFIACIALAGLCYRYAARWKHEQPRTTIRHISWRAAAIVLIVLCTRGGLQLIPIGVMNAASYAPPPYFPVVLNTPFTIMMTIGKPVLEEKQYMTQAEADRLWPVVHNYQDQKNTPLPIVVAAQRPNVVVIILESFSAAYSGKLTSGPGYMPFLDSLMGESLNFTHAYANGRRSIDGIPAITSSLPEWMDEAFITSPYAGSSFTSLASILSEEGYHTSFYHGGRNGTMGFDGFARAAGYQRYVGMNEYPDPADYDDAWGIWDRPFLQFFAQDLTREQEPFLSTVFTLSSHHPYKLPPAEAQRFIGGTQRIHSSLRYTDDALRQFFSTARQQPWFARTLFVITADHTADIDRTGQNYSEAADYWVPLLYHMPTMVAVADHGRITQHIDIGPTVLDMIGHAKPFFSFGASALREERIPIAIMHTTGGFLAIDSSSVYRFDGEQVPPQPMNMTLYRAPSAESVNTVKAAIQQFTGRVLRNEMNTKSTTP